MKYGYYCLKCYSPNMGCKCRTKEFTFEYSHKLRVPLSHFNRPQFRKFLRDCPIFVNGVPLELQSMFRDFLRDLNFFDEAINGKDWTRVLKNKEEDRKYYSKISELSKEKELLLINVDRVNNCVRLLRESLYSGDIEKIKQSSDKLYKIYSQLI